MDAFGADLVGMVENQGRTYLAHRSRAVALIARHFQQGFLVQEIATEMLIDIENNWIDLEKRGDGPVGMGDWITGIDRVAEIAGVAEVVTGGHRGGVGRGEGREQRVRSLEIDSLVT